MHENPLRLDKTFTLIGVGEILSFHINDEKKSG